jgi:predicted component of type VI protein secretion system
VSPEERAVLSRLVSECVTMRDEAAALTDDDMATVANHAYAVAAQIVQQFVDNGWIDE